MKMSVEGFLKNNRGINDGADLDPDFMRALYDRIVSNEIKVSAGRIKRLDSDTRLDNLEAHVIRSPALTVRSQGPCSQLGSTVKLR